MSTEINKESLKTDSNISSMRVQFNKVVNTAIGIAIIATLGVIILPFFDKTIDIAGIVALDSLFLGIAFGGKAAQAAFEKQTDLPIATPEETKKEE